MHGTRLGDRNCTRTTRKPKRILIYEEIEEELLGKLKHLFIKILLDKTPENEVLVEQKDYKNYILIL
ncbi:MAG TPA: hypothetical protein VFD00_02320, partial [Thermoclostridium sp.]|nr:hypothetical protein [Thermoclostridium sp.]